MARQCDLASLLVACMFLSLSLGARGIPPSTYFNESIGAKDRELLSQSPLDYVLSKYLDNSELINHLEDFAQRCGSISRLVHLGTSVRGVPLVALEISKKTGKPEAKPNVKIVGGIHGDEPGGRVLTVALAEWLCDNYQKDPNANDIVNGVRLWLLPAMNPDGFAARSRENANGADLNRDFPDHYTNPPFTSPAGTTHQPETVAVIKWSTSMHFVSSLALHQGALVANYPWDSTRNGNTAYSASPDDKTFRFLASTYADARPGMTGSSNPSFPTGITNGAAWYSVFGGMQDWNYGSATRCMELTIEMGPKYPPEFELKRNFENDKEAVLKFITSTAFGGLRGFVKKAGIGNGTSNSPLREATISVRGTKWTVTSGRQFGDYYRPLAPGTYVVQVTKSGYKSSAATITVPADGRGVTHNFELMKLKRKNSNSFPKTSVSYRRR